MRGCDALSDPARGMPGEFRSQLHPYLVHHVMRLVIRRAHELELWVVKPLRVTEREVFSLMERILFDFIRRGRERYAL